LQKPGDDWGSVVPLALTLLIFVLIFFAFSSGPQLLVDLYTGIPLAIPCAVFSARAIRASLSVFPPVLILALEWVSPFSTQRTGNG